MSTCLFLEAENRLFVNSHIPFPLNRYSPHSNPIINAITAKTEMGKSHTSLSLFPVLTFTHLSPKYQIPT
jgi:hypothetical protein